MKLFYRKYGQGQPFIILHGLFGQSDNWNTLAKQFSLEGYEVYCVDQRNHGLSPHSETWNYQVMSDDVLELIKDNNLSNVIMLGQSMGGKTAMQFAVQQQELLNKLIVVDIGPKSYPTHNKNVLNGLNAVDFTLVKTRKEAEAVLSEHIHDSGTEQFLLKNIYWKENGQLDWRFDLKTITREIESVGEAISVDDICTTNALFIRGGASDYILDEDLNLIHDIFPNATLETIDNAAHWVHAEKPIEFFDCVMRYIK